MFSISCPSSTSGLGAVVPSAWSFHKDAPGKLQAISPQHRSFPFPRCGIIGGFLWSLDHDRAFTSPLGLRSLLTPLSIVSLPLDDKPRKPPPPATPLTFPRHEPKDISSYGEEVELDLIKLFKAIRPNIPLTPLHVSALNLHVSRDVPIAQLFPEQHLPLPLWEEGVRNGAQQIAEVPVQPQLLNNGSPGPTYQNYSSFVKELLLDNEDVFYTMERRKPDPSRTHVRTIQFRRFYQELLVVAGYWDTSLDGTNPVANSTPLPPTSAVATPNNDTAAPNPSPSATPEYTYMGRRISTGSDMPASFQHRLLCEFIIPVIRAFGCHYDTPRSQPYLSLRNLRLPVNFSGMVFRPPKQKPTSDIESLEGPLIAVQSRSQTKFGDGEGPTAIADILKEVGAMLLLAQQRAREGTEEVIANADQWFVTAPRWGGGTGLAFGQPLGFGSREEALEEKKKQDGVSEQSEEPPTKKRTHERSSRPPREKDRDLPKADRVEKSTLPPTSKWDRRIKHLRIGKPEGEFDDVRCPPSYIALQSTNSC